MSTIANEVKAIENAIAAGEWKEAVIRLEAIKSRKPKKADAEKIAALTEEVASNAAAQEAAIAAKMSSQLAKYRVNYKIGLTAEGNKSLHNGDLLACFLERKSPEEVCAIADKWTGSENGHHAARYAKLNPGQRRMNAGNRLRALVKKGEIEVRDNDGKLEIHAA